MARGSARLPTTSARVSTVQICIYAHSIGDIDWFGLPGLNFRKDQEAPRTMVLDNMTHWRGGPPLGPTDLSSRGVRS